MQSLCDLTTDTLDTANGLHIELLPRELDRRIARVDTSELDMLTDRIGDDLATLCDVIDLYLLGVLDELAHDDRVLFRDLGSKLEEAIELLGIGADVHSCP